MEQWSIALRLVGAAFCRPIIPNAAESRKGRSAECRPYTENQRHLATPVNFFAEKKRNQQQDPPPSNSVMGEVLDGTTHKNGESLKEKSKP